MEPKGFQVIRSILIVEDDKPTQEELIHAARIFPKAEIHCTATKSGAEEIARQRDFDMAIIDIGLPDGSGIDIIRIFSQSKPHVICVARTVFDDDQSFFGALSAGAQGYLLKGQPNESIQKQLQAAANGEPVISPSIARKVLSFFKNNYPITISEEKEPNPLTQRETDALTHIAKGLTISETAQRMKISDNTVKTHIKSAYSKLNISTRAEAAHAARRLGLV